MVRIGWWALFLVLSVAFTSTYRIWSMVEASGGGEIARNLVSVTGFVCAMASYAALRRAIERASVGTENLSN